MNTTTTAIKPENILLLCRTFFHWWGRELAKLVPRQIKSLLAPTEPISKIIIDQQQTQIVTSQQRELSTDKITRFDLGIDKLIQDKAFSACLKQLKPGPVTIEISPTLILERDLEMPEAARSNAKDIVQLQPEKYFPLAAEALYFDAKPATSSQDNPQQPNSSKRFTLRLAMIKKASIQPLVGMVEHSGAWVSSITGVSANKPSSTFQFADFSAQYKSREQKIALGLGALIILLSITLFISGYYKQAARQTYLKEQISLMSAKAQQIQILQSSIHKAEKQYKLYQQKVQRITTADVLASLSQTLPADSWVYEYSETDGRYSLSGKTSNTSKLVNLLDQNPLFTHVSNSSTMSQEGADIGLERFTLSFNIANPKQQCREGCQ
jgi:general secretion pathway protein L